MSLSKPFIVRPVATTLLALAILVVGIVAYISLPVAPLPNVDFPTLQVSTSLPGASPDTMASNVATPLERQFSLIPGIVQMTSASSYGSTSITLQFQLGQSIPYDFEQVQAAINAASAQLPSNLPAQPTIRQTNPADTPIMVLSLTSDTIPIDQVDNYADVILTQRLSSIAGVGLVTLGGQQKPAVRIQLDPRKVAARGLNIDTVRATIVASTVNAPKGSTNGGTQGLTIYANDQILSADGWKKLVIGYQHGAAVHLPDVGSVSDGVENNQLGAWVFPGPANPDSEMKHGQGILLPIYKAPGANVIKTVDAIRAQLPMLEANIPPGIHVSILRDSTQTINAAVLDVEKTLIITIVLVVAVIFVFLLDFRATIIPATVIPLALLGAAGVLLALGDSLDNLSLMALSIAVGFVVDDAIVIVEVIWQHLEKGETPMQAAINGAGEVGFTILSISISLIAVFTPLMFMSGVVGLLLREFAIALSAAVLFSMVLCLTVTPMLCARFLKEPHPPKHKVTKFFDNSFRRLEQSYERGLHKVMEHRLLTMVVFVITLVIAGLLYATAHTGFFPQEDTGLLSGVMRTSQDATFAKARDKVQDVGRIISSDPDVTAVGAFVGSGSANQANMFIALKPRDEGRTTTADEIIARLRPKLAQLVGVNTYLQASQDINLGGRAGQAQYQYTLSDSNIDELNKWAPKLLANMGKLSELRDVNTDQQSQGASLTLDIDREAAARFGLNPTLVDTEVYDMLGQAEVAQYYTQQNSYHVVVEAPARMQQSPDILNSLYLLSPTTGKTVPLSLFVHAKQTTSPVTINHQGEFPAVTLAFNLAPGISLSQATQAVTQLQNDLGAPPTLNGAFQGNAQAFQQSLSSEPVLIVAALLAVYVILGVLYESFIHPITILSTLPSAGVGALLALKVAGQDLNVIGIIAIILLIGIVKKNGIMIVDVAMRLEREENLSAEDAAFRASIERFRPILMTTACAALGGVPMILMNGTGSEFRQPLGYAIVGGLLVSQILTLFTTPVVYTYLDKLRGENAHKPAVQDDGQNDRTHPDDHGHAEGAPA